jgi:hypothetical protein
MNHDGGGDFSFTRTSPNILWGTIPRVIQSLKVQLALATVALLIVRCSQAQNVYSLSVYSAGTSYRDLCSFEFPFAPHKFKLCERSWTEDPSGFTVMDISHRADPGNVLRRTLEIECGSNSFAMPLPSIPPKRARADSDSPGTKGSGDLARMIVDTATSRGGRAASNSIPTVQATWILKSQGNLDVIVVDADYFTEIQTLLRQAYGAPDTTLVSSAPVGNGRSLCYTPQEIGIVLNLTDDWGLTIVSVIGKRKP